MVEVRACTRADKCVYEYSYWLHAIIILSSVLKADGGVVGTPSTPARTPNPIPS